MVASGSSGLQQTADGRGRGVLRKEGAMAGPCCVMLEKGAPQGGNASRECPGITLVSAAGRCSSSGRPPVSGSVGLVEEVPGVQRAASQPGGDSEPGTDRAPAVTHFPLPWTQSAPAPSREHDGGCSCATDTGGCAAARPLPLPKL